ncbi:hypothetical protein FQR65_LT17349 [Abscondita terminalis]|nr:hypothetical protein FQR65_LT17349 [Abscondita terminalis]
MRRKQGYPPLKIEGECFPRINHEVSIKGNISSQYISSLLLIAAALKKGLTLHIEGELTSRPYVSMTLDMLKEAGNSFGEVFRITTFGESHGEAIGVIIDGCPSNIEIDETFIQSELDKRKPGQSKITTQRKESDTAQILSGGIQGGISNGMDITFRTAFKPVATIMRDQETVNTEGESLDTSAGIREAMDNSSIEIRYINDAAAFLQGEIFASKLDNEEKNKGITLGTGLGSAVWSKGNIATYRDTESCDSEHLERERRPCHIPHRDGEDRSLCTTGFASFDRNKQSEHKTLILSPTRELAQQTYLRIQNCTPSEVNINTISIVGGQSYEKQAAELSTDPAISGRYSRQAAGSDGSETH